MNETEFSEDTLGDFSDDGATPEDIGTLEDGGARVTAEQSGDPRDVDYVTFEVPEGAELTGLTIEDYDAGSGNLAFLGLQSGAIFTVDPLAPSADALLGGITYGESDEGTDVLDEIGSLSGAIGFDGPLGPGEYTLWFNQTGPSSRVTVVLDLSSTAGEGDQVGTEGDDILQGDDNDNLLEGLGGDDTISGGAGVDTLDGGEGDDELVGNTGNDTVLGRAGDDLLVWNNGDGSDLFDGGEGDDRAQVNFNTNLVDTDLQNDDVAQIEVTDEGVRFARIELNGQQVNGLFAIDIENTETLEVNFGGGDDRAVLDGGIAAAIALELNGGDGDDTLDLAGFGEGVYVQLGEDTGSIRNFGALAGPETFNIAANDFENAIGTEFDDFIEGNSEANVISGGLGVDTLEGGDGNDTLVGNRGNDIVSGEGGDDLLVWNNGDGSDQFDGGEGNDRAQVNFNTDLSNDDLQNDDVARIEVTDEGVRFARIELNGQQVNGLFAIDIENTETLEVNFGGGNDRAVLDGDIATAIQLELNGGAEEEDGSDTLDLAAFGEGVAVELGETGSIRNVDAASDGPETFNVAANGFEDVIGTAFDDRIQGDNGSNALTGGAGSDLFVFAGDPFKGTDVSAAGRDIVGGEDFISDFEFDADAYLIDAADFGIEGDVVFAAVDLSDPGAVIPADANVIVVLNTDNDGDPETPFLAGTAAAQIAGQTDASRPGIFVYHNSNLELNRVVFSSDLSSAEADLSILSRQTDLTGQDAIDALADFSAENFVFENVVGDDDDDDDLLTVGTDGDDAFVAAGGVNETFEGLDGDDSIEIGASVADADIAAIDGGFEVALESGETLTLLSVETLVFEDATLEADFGETAASVFRLFETVGDTPDAGALAAAVEQVDSGIISLFELATTLSAAEGLLNPAISTAEFVEGLYQSAFDRASDAGGFEFWTSELDEGRLERGDVAFFFAGSPEALGVFENDTDDGVLLLA